MTEEEMMKKIEKLEAENLHLRCVMKSAYYEIVKHWDLHSESKSEETYKLLQFLHGKHRRVSHENNPYPQFVESVEKSKQRYVSWASDSTLTKDWKTNNMNVTLSQELRDNIWNNVPSAIASFCIAKKVSDDCYDLTLVQDEHGDQKQYTIYKNDINVGLSYIYKFGIDYKSLAERVCYYSDYNEDDVSIIIQFALWGETFYY